MTDLMSPFHGATIELIGTLLLLVPPFKAIYWAARLKFSSSRRHLIDVLKQSNASRPGDNTDQAARDADSLIHELANKINEIDAVAIAGGGILLILGQSIQISHL